jgi:hypothetical protein
MAQRIEFRFGKNSSFECDVEQLDGPLTMTLRPDGPGLYGPWAKINTVNGGTRWINTARCTQIILGLPDKEAT